MLGELLSGYESRLKAAGVPTDEWLAPGLPEQAIRDELASVGLVAPDELVVWFGWRNGLSPKVPRRVSITALPNFDPLSLREAVQGYVLDVLEFEAPPVVPGRAPIPIGYYQYGVTEGWMRLIASVRGCAIECVAPSSEPPRLRSADENFYDEAPDGFYQAVSLCTLVD